MKIKTLPVKELQAKKPADIEKYILELQDNLKELTHAVSTGKENKTHNFNVIKKAIARAKTVLAAAQGEEK